MADEDKSTKSFVRHSLRNDLLSCGVDRTSLGSIEKSDPICSDVGTLAINSVFTHGFL